MTKTKWLLLFGSVGVLGFGLYRYFKTQASILKNFTWTIVGLKILNISLTELSFDVTFLFTSKADLEAKINKLYLDILLEGQNVGYITETKEFIIPANGSSKIPIHISINPQSIFKNIVNLLLITSKQKDVKFAFDGYANIKSGFISTTLPIKYENTLKQYLQESKVVK